MGESETSLHYFSTKISEGHEKMNQIDSIVCLDHTNRLDSELSGTV